MTIRKENKMKKFMDILAVILFFIWLFVLIVLHFAIGGVIKQQFPKNFAENLIYGILGIAAWWGLMIGVYTVWSRISAKIERKKERIYKEKYVTEVIIEDDFFGRIVFENDSFKGRLHATEMNFPPFGAEALEEFYIEGYTENDREKIFRALRGIYEHKEEILDRLCDEVLEFVEEYEETDENGEPYTPEIIRERVYIWWTRVYNGEHSLSVVMECSLTEGELELGGHGIETVIDVDDRELSFTLEG